MYTYTVKIDSLQTMVKFMDFETYNGYDSTIHRCFSLPAIGMINIENFWGHREGCKLEIRGEDVLGWTTEAKVLEYLSGLPDFPMELKP